MHARKRLGGDALEIMKMGEIEGEGELPVGGIAGVHRPEHRRLIPAAGLDDVEDMTGKRGKRRLDGRNML